MSGGLAIVLSGGGAKGAFQVGVLDELITQRGVQAQHWVGVSTGSIQALGGAMADIPGLVRHWTTITGDGDIYKKRLLGLIAGLLGKPSLYKSGPLRERLAGYANKAKLDASGKSLLVGTVDLSTRKFHNKSPATLGPGETIAEWVYASCAQPPYFEPLERPGPSGKPVQWVDGGVRNVTPLSAAMDLNPKAILMIITSPEDDPAALPSDKSYDTLIEIVGRCVSTLVNEVATNDVKNATLINDMLSAINAQKDELASQGITGAAADAIIAPFEKQIKRYEFVPVMAIRPRFQDKADLAAMPDTLEFNPLKLGATINYGRRVARENWPAVEAFLRSSGVFP